MNREDTVGNESGRHKAWGWQQRRNVAWQGMGQFVVSYTVGYSGQVSLTTQGSWVEKW
jgi:hypothetical protein